MYFTPRNPTSIMEDTMHQYQLDKPDNLIDFLEESIEKYPDCKMLGTKNSAGDYEWITYADFGKRVDNCRA